MVNPQFIDIHHFTEAKPDNKAEQISRDEFAAKYHEYTDKKTLKIYVHVQEKALVITRLKA